MRAALLAKLIDDHLAAAPFHRKTEELAALIDMAIEQGCCVRLDPDRLERDVLRESLDLDRLERDFFSSKTGGRAR